MNGIFLTLGVLQIVVPLLPLAWQRRERSASKARWLFKTISAAACLTALAIAGLWSWIPFFVPYMFLAASFALALRGWFRVRRLPFWRAEMLSERVKFGLTALIGAFALGLTFYALSGWSIPTDSAIELAFPLRDGSFYIANGGSNSLVNPHLNTLEGERFPAVSRAELRR